jgi:hypothetical protein
MEWSVGGGGLVRGERCVICSSRERIWDITDTAESGGFFLLCARVGGWSGGEECPNRKERSRKQFFHCENALVTDIGLDCACPPPLL